MNPFIFGKPVIREDFAHRSEVEKLTQYIQGNEKVWISGHHKIGKTSLVFNALQHLSATHYPVYLDCRFLDTAEALETSAIRSVIDAESKFLPSKEVLTRFINYRPVMRLNDLTGDEYFEVSLKNFKVHRIGECFKMLRPLQGLKPVLVVDNIQDLFGIKGPDVRNGFLDLLLSLAEEVLLIESLDLSNSSAVCKDLLLGKITPLSLQAIEDVNYEAFARTHLALKEISLSQSFFEDSLQIAGPLSQDRQVLFNALFEVSPLKSSLDHSNLSAAVKWIFSKNQESFEQIFLDLTDLQKRVLKLLAQNPESKIYSKEFSDELKVANSNSAVKIIQALSQKRVIYKNGAFYAFFNPFFREWIRQTYR